MVAAHLHAPRHERGEAVLEPDQVGQVHHEPHDPGEEPGHLELADLDHGRVAGDGRHRPLVEVLEGAALLGAGALLDLGDDLLCRVLAALDGDLGHARQLVQAGHVAHHEEIRVAGDGEVLVHEQTARAVDLRAGLTGENGAQRARLHACGPDLAGAVDPAARAVGVLYLDAVVVDVRDHRVELDLDAHLLETAPRLVAQVRAHRGEHRRGRVEQHDAGRGRVDVPERSLERLLRELGDLTGHLDARRPGAHDDEGEEAATLLLVVGDLGLLEAPEDPRAEFEGVVHRLHAGGVLLEVVVAEVRLVGTGGHDEAVVLQVDLDVAGRGVDGLVGHVDLAHVAEDAGGVLLVAEHDARRRRDLADGEDAGGDLVQQRLEQVVRGPGDEGDLDVVVAGELLRREEAAEARPDDDDTVLASGSGAGGPGGGVRGLGHCGSWLDADVGLAVGVPTAAHVGRSPAAPRARARVPTIVVRRARCPRGRVRRSSGAPRGSTALVTRRPAWPGTDRRRAAVAWRS